MASVVLENIFKSFPARSGGTVSPVATHSFVVPGSPAPSPEPETTARPGLVNVLRRINLSIADGELMVLVGPSGCGKSTLLRAIAGLETVTSGNIWVGDRLVNHQPPKTRDIAMVFQNYALYPHMNVYDNIAFGLRRMKSSISPSSTMKLPRQSKLTAITTSTLATLTRKLPHHLQYRSAKDRVIEQQVNHVAQLLQIEGLLNRRPKQLSGGQKQRVALGRAIARNPQVFLMDEPLSNLDAKLRAETRTQIVQLQRQLDTTTIYVTHDQVEAMTMGHRIAVMNQGQIQQVASPLELYNHPANQFVAEFIGSPPMNFLRVQIVSPTRVQTDQFRLTIPRQWEVALSEYVGRSLLLGIRPEHLSLSQPAPRNFTVQVDLVEALGNDTYLSVRTTTHPAQSLQVRTSPEHTVYSGETIWLAIDPQKIHFFDPSSGQAIATT